jgi:SAM-dependent methyltransferase
MDFTGERYVPGACGDIELEHLHRYCLAGEIAADKVVLDIASGEGYGAAMLATRAQKVIGVDLAAAAVAHARAKYPLPNLQFIEGSCASIPLPAASVDLVVSFETIEHHDQHEAMLREFKRVLRAGGVALISSPDKLHYAEATGYNNPYHCKELYADEFRRLLASHFSQVRYFGQRIAFGSCIFAESEATTSAAYCRDGDAVATSRGLARPLYSIALAADGPLPALASGIFEQPLEDSAMARAWREAVAGQAQTIRQMNATVAAIHASRSWRLTRPLRALSAFTRRLRR